MYYSRNKDISNISAVWFISTPLFTLRAEPTTTYLQKYRRSNRITGGEHTVAEKLPRHTIIPHLRTAIDAIEIGKLISKL